MRALAVLFVFCFLQQAIGMSVKDFMQGSRRKVREVDAPAPIDCKMSAWSVWGNCDPCTKTMHRSRGIDIFGQFGGQRCIESIGDKRSCVPTTKCEEDPPPVCTSSEFQCESGLCIQKRLVCNGDNDCGDFSDEEECDKIRSPCGNIAVTESDIGRAAGYGINILGSGPRMNPFNNKIYKGTCERIKDPATLQYNRLPWNVAVLHFETLVEESSSKEIYEDTYSLIKELTKDTTSKTSLGLSFKFTPTETQQNDTLSIGGSGGLNTDTEKGNMVKTITEETNVKGKTFIRVKGKVQLGTYRLRSRSLEVSETFLDGVDALPIIYEKGQYFGFMEDFGTHYTKNGRSGGEYDLVYVLNSDVMTKKKVTETTLRDCLKIAFNTDLQIMNQTLGQFEPGMKSTPNDDCQTLTEKQTEGGGENKAVIDKVISSVKGGSPQFAAAMKSQLSKDGLLDWQRYVEWARSIGELPALLYSEPEPIYNAIPLNIPDAQPRRENLQRALDEYMAEYSVCKCQPCQNGGTVAQVDGQCVCLCPMQFEGVACQIIRHELMKDKSQPVQQKGNWACWSAWSSCNAGRRTRTRNCNTADIAGATCKGEAINEDYC
ncbi:complement component C9 [Salminus brasiliensis]|uniref:complement component C9 n=1 Tax=Salminus brasiliensis TaxID=930266 RepID=UPI003B83A00E